MPSIPSGTPIWLASYLPLWKTILACHAHHFALVPIAGVPRRAFKWHAQVIILSWRATPSIPRWKLGVPRLRYQVARPWLKWWVRRATPNLACHTPLVVFIVALWKFVLACHAQLLACHTNAFLWCLLQVARQFHTPNLFCCFLPLFDVFFT
ncbi:hypothetical protein AHAS_Ahas19G0189500 [Arachis hypogaea]